MKLVEILKEDLFSDARKARAAKSRAEKPVWLHRLNGDGNESRMNDARTYFKTEADAKAHHDSMVKLNPGKKIGHMLYSDVGDTTMKVMLVNGKFKHAPGGLTHEDDGAEDNFMAWLDDQGSAAGMWMAAPMRTKLFNLYKNGHAVKSTGTAFNKKDDPSKIDAKIKKFKDGWTAKGWKFFASDETDEYVDMIFTKEPK